MSTLDRVMEMRGEGYAESQIIDALKQEGVSPKDIYNAITQSSIKSEVSQVQMTDNTQEMSQTGYSPMENDPNQYQGYPQQQQEYAQPQENYPQQDYGQSYQEYQAPQPANDIETINEIAEQIVEEKTVEIKKQMTSFKNSNEETKSDVERMNKRLEKLENNFNEMQVAILRKIGEYGENIKNISSEMHQTQDSFSKILNPLTDNIRELQKMTGDLDKPEKQPQKQEPAPKKEVTQSTTTQTTTVTEEPRRVTKPEPGFEDFLR